MLQDCTLFETARAGSWYTENISLTGCTVEAPKALRRAAGITLTQVAMPNASETLWNCRDVRMAGVSAKGGYFAMDSQDTVADGLQLTGNYAFDGRRNVEIHSARMLSKAV